MLPPHWLKKCQIKDLSSVPVCKFLWSRIFWMQMWISSAHLFSKVALPISTPSIDIWKALFSMKCKQVSLSSDIEPADWVHTQEPQKWDLYRSGNLLLYLHLSKAAQSNLTCPKSDSGRGTPTFVLRVFKNHYKEPFPHRIRGSNITQEDVQSLGPALPSHEV